MRLYPKAYRDERGAEMLATLAEADRPTGRETAALVVGALRARAGVARLASPGRLWLSALRLAALMLVAHATAQAAARAVDLVVSYLFEGRGLVLANQLGPVGALVVGASALVALAAGRYRLGVALTAGAFAFTLWGLTWYPEVWGMLVDDEIWQLPLALLLTVPLLWRRPPPAARPAVWLLAVPAALLLLPTPINDSQPWHRLPFLALGVLALVWSVIDARVAIAASALFLVQVLTLLGYYAPIWSNGPDETRPLLVIYAAYAAVLIAAGAPLTPRQARL